MNFIKKYVNFLLLVLMIWFCQNIFAQTPPTLECVNDVTNNAIAVAWQNNDNCGGNFVSTNIYTSDSPSGTFNLISSINDFSVETDTVPSAGTTTYVYVETECGSGISAPSEIIASSELPAPEIIRVEVLGGSSRLEWISVNEAGTFGYIIYGPGPVPIDTVFDADANFYTYTLGTPDLAAETYTISTIDSCLNSGPFTDFHTTIFTSTVYDTCQNIVNINWTDYVGWSAQEYIIYKEIGGLQTPLDTVVAGTNDFSYTVLPSDGNSGAFSVKAVGSIFNETSNSNAVTIDFQEVAVPDFIYMRNATVESSNNIKIDWYTEGNVTTENLYLNRGRNVSEINVLENLGPITTLPLMETNDNTTNTERDSYYYSVTAANECEASVTSGLVRTLQLDGSDNVDLTNTLSWNDFEIENGVVQNYVLYRQVNGSLEAIATLGGSTTDYNDDVAGINPEGGGYCYQVEAIFDLDIPSIGVDETLSSFSDIICIGQTSRIWVPNAFKPSGINNVFLPIIQFPNPETYSMVVMNRWGEIVFETNDPDQGWDGNIRGNIGQQGVYTYYITMQSLNGNNLERKGTVLLLK